MGCRLWRGPYWLVHWPNQVWQSVREQTDWPICSHAYDPQLGWTSNPGFTSPHYNVGPEGYRRTPDLPDAAAAQSAVLATGDSFTEGEEVDDEEAWPAQLQGLLDRPVINAGVIGYGLDQTVLRTEQAAARLRPAVAVVSFIPDDLLRNQFKRVWSEEKPYFVLHDGELELRNVPVPAPSAGCDSLPFWRRMLGWSVMVDGIVRRLGWQQEWYYEAVSILPAGEGEKLACPLMQRLARIGVPTLVVAQFGRDAWEPDETEAARQKLVAQHVLQCATQAGLATLDLFDTMQQAVRQRGIDALYRLEHHSGAGNRLVAQSIATELSRRHLLPEARPAGDTARPGVPGRSPTGARRQAR